MLWTSIHSTDVTDAMRESVMQGQPLFEPSWMKENYELPFFDDFEGDIIQLAEKEGIYGHPGTKIEEGNIQVRGEAIAAVRALARSGSEDSYRRRGQLANGISREFRESGGTKLVGQKIGSTKDLATLAQLYRNPRFETFRWIFVKKK